MIEALDDFAVRYVSDFAAHVVASSVVLLVVLAAATWIRPLTARTRNAVLVAGLGALLVPPALFERLAAVWAVQQTVVALPRLPLLTAALPGPASASTSGFPWAAAAVALWLTVATLLLLRWWLMSHRLVSTAIRLASPPPEKTVAALDAARRRLSLRQSVDLVVSPLAEGPAVLRVLRPLLVLPPGISETLDDAELESLLCHECAHVTRRDNLVGVFEALLCSLFWFNPLVWLAHRGIGITREAACDERVAESAIGAGTYASALAKFCQSLIAPRVAGVSCMASAHLKERMEHLMNYESLRTRALSHRAISTLAASFVLAFVIAAGIVTAQPAVTTDAGSGPYRLDYSVQRISEKQIQFQLSVIDAKSDEVIIAPTVTTHLGQLATTRSDELGPDRNLEFVIAMDSRPDASGSIRMEVRREGKEIQRVTREFGAQAVQEAPAKYTGQPISLNLHNADIHDVLKTFGELTGIEMVIAPEIKRTVTVSVTGRPWDEVLDHILRENGLTWRLENGKMEIVPVGR